MITVAGLDLGTSGKSSIAVVRGDENFHVKMIHLKTFQSISGPDLEIGVERIHAKFSPQMWLMETNGPGEVFAGYMERNRPHIPLATIDTSLALPDDYKLMLWDDIEVNTKLVLNVRAAMYWTLRCFFRDQYIKLYKEDEELFAQLSCLRWDHDMARGDKIYMLSKRKLHMVTSDLDEEPFSKSPDKADSLALGLFAYCLRREIGDDEQSGAPLEDEIIQPTEPGMFSLIGFDEGAEYA